MVLASCGSSDFVERGDAAVADATIDAASMVAYYGFETGFEGGTCVGGGCPIGDVGLRGQGLAFDGVSQCLQLPPVQAPAFTVSLWLKPCCDNRAAVVSKLFDSAASN